MLLLILTIIAVLVIVVGTIRWKVHPFLLLLIASLIVGVGSGLPSTKVVEAMQEGFGKTLGNIGVVILLGVIIGTFLENTGGAYRLAEAVLKLIGQKRIHSVMAYMGFIISIPVFCDSGFVIMNSLNKALSKRAGVAIAGTATALAMGLIASHVLVPPTPGPIAAAGILGANLGLVILWGCVVGILALLPVIAFAKTLKQEATEAITEKSLNAPTYEETLKNAPSLTKSMLPVALPLLLIMLKSVNDSLLWFSDGTGKGIIDFIGTPMIALAIGFIAAFALTNKLTDGKLAENGWVGSSLAGAASIVFITGAGGAFGKVLQTAGIAEMVGTWLSNYPIGILLPFILSAALKTAQGSSTVAMITTASLIVPLLEKLGVTTDMQRVWFTLAIGAGSLVVSHVNDSFFWVTTQFSGLSTSTGYRTITVASAILGCSCMVIIWLFSQFL